MQKTKLNPWVIVNSKVVHKTPWMEVIEDECAVDDKTLTYTYTRRVDGPASCHKKLITYKRYPSDIQNKYIDNYNKELFYIFYQLKSSKNSPLRKLNADCYLLMFQFLMNDSDAKDILGTNYGNSATLFHELNNHAKTFKANYVR